MPLLPPLFLRHDLQDRLVLPGAGLPLPALDVRPTEPERGGAGGDIQVPRPALRHRGEEQPPPVAGGRPAEHAEADQPGGQSRGRLVQEVLLPLLALLLLPPPAHHPRHLQPPPHRLDLEPGAGRALLEGPAYSGGHQVHQHHHHLHPRHGNDLRPHRLHIFLLQVWSFGVSTEL